MVNLKSIPHFDNFQHSYISYITKEYFELLRTIRQAQYVQDCKKSSCPNGLFRKPLGARDEAIG